MRCPVCKAENLQGPHCRRCKANLSLLFSLEEQRRRALTEARRCLHRSDRQAAVRHAETANWLRNDEDSLQLAAVASLLGRNFVDAWQYYQNWRAGRRSE